MEAERKKGQTDPLYKTPPAFRGLFLSIIPISLFRGTRTLRSVLRMSVTDLTSDVTSPDHPTVLSVTDRNSPLDSGIFLDVALVVSWIDFLIS